LDRDKERVDNDEAGGRLKEFQSLFYWIEIKNEGRFGRRKEKAEVSILVLLDRDKEHHQPDCLSGASN